MSTSGRGGPEAERQIPILRDKKEACAEGGAPRLATSREAGRTGGRKALKATRAVSDRSFVAVGPWTVEICAFGDRR